MVIEANPVMITHIIELVTDFRKNPSSNLNCAAVGNCRFPLNVIVFEALLEAKDALCATSTPDDKIGSIFFHSSGNVGAPATVLASIPVSFVLNQSKDCSGST